MKKFVKVTSILVIAAALIGAGGVYQNVTDSLNAKSYYEQKDVESTENLNKLEDGLNQLQENEQAYLDGRVALAEGKEQYAEGKATLEAGYAEYNKGLQTYEDGLAEYNAGKAKLAASTSAYLEGKEKKVQAKQVYDAVNKLMNGYSYKEAVATVAEATGNEKAVVEKGYENGSPKAYKANLKNLAAAKEAYDNVNMLMSKKDENTAVKLAAQSTGKPAADIQSAYENVNALLEAKGDASKASQIAAQSSGQDVGDIQNAYENVSAILAAKGDAEKASQIVSQSSGKDAEDIQSAYENVSAILAAKGDPKKASEIVANSSGKSATQVQSVYSSMKALLAVNGNPSKAAAIVANNMPDQYKGLITVSDIVDVYNAISSGEYTTAQVADSKKLPEPLVVAAYGQMSAIINIGDDVDAAAAIVVSNSGGAATTDEVKSAYANVKAMVDGLTVDEASAMVAQAAAAQGKETTPAEVKSAYANVKAMIDGLSVEEASAMVAQAAVAQGKETTPAEVKSAYTNVKAIVDGLTVDEASAMVAQAAAAQGKETTPAEVQSAYEGVKALMEGYTKEQAIATVAAASGKTEEEVAYGYSMGDEKSQKAKKAELEKAKQAYEAVTELMNGYSYDKSIATVAAKTGNSKETIELGYNNGNKEAQKAIQAQLDEYEKGQRKLAAAKVQLEDGAAKLRAAEVQLAEGEEALKDAERQLKEGADQLAEFEDGRDQLIDGLDTAIETPADGDLESVASRLGDGFNYMKNETDLDISKGFEVLGAARAYKSDSGVAITKELTGRFIAAAVTALASVICLIAGALGLAKKNKGSGIMALAGAVTAGVAIVLASSAGMVFSNLAGSNVGFLAASGGMILAIVSAIHGASALSSAKAAASIVE